MFVLLAGLLVGWFSEKVWVKADAEMVMLLVVDTGMEVDIMASVRPKPLFRFRSNTKTETQIADTETTFQRKLWGTF